ncbi:MAG: hypothetical protein EOM34_08825 [Clostridia bacterium]|nr:hypothetical protein [Lachnospiraceae bacterium]NCC00769.1 hypothetical protein [Clostridia bacterium]NCD03133.1 hypothetical protein [Clostridia bacterium]
MLLNLGIIFIMSLFAAGKTSVQGGYGKKYVVTSGDTVLFNGLIFGSTALVFLCALGWNRPTAGTVLYAIGFGTLSCLYQWTYLSAMRCGSVSLTVMFSNFNLIVSMAIGIGYFKDSMNGFNILGVLLFAGAAYLIIIKKKDMKPVSVKWLVFATATLVVGGLMAVEMRFYRLNPYGNENKAFVIIAYIAAFFISMLMTGLYRLRKCEITIPMKKKLTWICCIVPGTCLGVFQLLQLELIPRMDATTLYPLLNSLSIIISALAGKFFLGDCLSKRQLAGMGVGIAAVVLVSV